MEETARFVLWAVNGRSFSKVTPPSRYKGHPKPTSTGEAWLKITADASKFGAEEKEGEEALPSGNFNIAIENSHFDGC